jgi:hypothetical protein
MRTIIAGSRDIKEYDTVLNVVINSGFIITQIVSGGAKGVDTIGEEIAREFQIPLVVFPANWAKNGSCAGPIRNEQMAENADALIAIWDGRSPGTKHMIKTAKQYGLKVYVSNN